MNLDIPVAYILHPSIRPSIYTSIHPSIYPSRHIHPSNLFWYLRRVCLSRLCIGWQVFPVSANVWLKFVFLCSMSSDISDIEITGNHSSLHDAADLFDDVDLAGERAADEIIHVRRQETNRTARTSRQQSAPSTALTGAVFLAWMVCQPEIPTHLWYKKLIPLEHDFEWWGDYCGSSCIVGIVVLYYVLRNHDYKGDAQTIAVHRTARSQAARIIGYVDYLVHDKIYFKRPWVIDHEAAPSTAFLLAKMEELRNISVYNVGTVSDWLTAHNYSIPTHALHKSFDEAACIMEGWVNIALFSVVGQRINIKVFTGIQHSASLGDGQRHALPQCSRSMMANLTTKKFYCTYHRSSQTPCGQLNGAPFETKTL